MLRTECGGFVIDILRLCSGLDIETEDDERESRVYVGMESREVQKHNDPSVAR